MWFLLLACKTPTEDASPPPSLTAPLAETEVRAGVVVDPASLFGGISAEGRPGDVKIYNDRVQFVIQQVGDSSYYAEYGGALIDADVVRPAGAPGRDLIDEFAPMIGLGRVVNASAVTVIADGSDGVAEVRVEGPTAPLQLITGALENPGLISDLDLWVTTTYRLEPGSWTLQVTTTVENRDVASSLSIGQVGIVAVDMADAWRPGQGLEVDGDGATAWTAVVGKNNEAALALLGDAGPLEQGTVGSILSAIAPTMVGFGPTEDVPAGGTLSWTARIGVGPDPATLSEAQLRWQQVPAQQLTGVVSADGMPVAGARVHVLDAAGDPLTLAFTNARGEYRAVVPSGPVSVVATGRGSGIQVDLAPGHGQVSAYDANPSIALDSLLRGGPVTPFAEGNGVGPTTTDWSTPTLSPSGTLSVRIGDGGPGVARLLFPNGDPAVVDRRLVPGRTDGAAAVGFIRDGALDLHAEPGTYTLVVNRGVRDEIAVLPVEVVAGQTTSVDVDLPRAYDPAGVLVGDPHAHAAPSGDGGLPMEERLLVAAGNGLDLHFGTDHDHIADYRPTVTALGLDDRLQSVVADEVSPVLRGHFNMWPATATDAANHGAPRWWFGYADTAEIFGWMRSNVGAEGVIQANHPAGSSGMFSFADYDPTMGVIGSPEHWSADFDAMEVLNSGDWAEYFPFYLDLISRGHPVTPVGVSDSHRHTDGRVGLGVTFFHTDGDLAGLTDDVLRATMSRGETVVGLGLYLDVTVDGAWAPGRDVPVGSTLDVRVWAASWVPVETVTLWKDGVAVESVACAGVTPKPCETAWPLNSDADAVWVVTAESATQPVRYVYPGTLAWGVTAPIRTDADGDGRWEAPREGLRP